MLFHRRPLVVGLLTAALLVALSATVTRTAALGLMAVLAQYRADMSQLSTSFAMQPARFDHEL
jgi:hypothetical protein